MALSERMDLPPPSAEEVAEIMENLDTEQKGNLTFEQLKPVLM